ncbi:putative short chain dehydrogenase [Talaromyces proteolyticus]|uniref:Short chain dehydrogenase n=1 Tax=Talaromyces proteolyticus TaxID=1131652 RepID=A0AAD4KQ85_9EURO|nr:putative short chain dehydrogenase [Talaromyces proteolyticus]KAH8693054.1 putative short chain dehydrogenase [Talaromyces proteolyticus]
MSGILSIKGRVAIVTGSSSGLGRAIALALASEGAIVVCSDITPVLRAGGYEADNAPTHEIIARTSKAIFKKADSSSAENMEALVEAAVATYGRLDIMVNNAGVFCGQHRVAEESVEAFDKTMAINSRGVFLGMKYAIAQMMKQEPRASGDRGWIVNISSIGGLVGLSMEPSYCASKGAVVALTRQAALDYAPDKIHINAVCPGFIRTAMVRSALEDAALNKEIHGATPWPHLGVPEDIGKTVLFLSGDGASWITGAVVNVDGGYCAQ